MYKKGWNVKSKIYPIGISLISEFMKSGHIDIRRGPECIIVEFFPPKKLGSVRESIPSNFVSNELLALLDGPANKAPI